MENNDAAMKDLVKNVSTGDLIAELRTRKLTSDDVSFLQTLKPAEEPTNQPTSEVKTEPIATTETSSSSERFVKAIERKNSFGKLPSGSTTDNKPIEGLGGGFYDHGPDKMDLPKAEGGVSSMQNNVLYQMQDKFPEQMSSHLVSVAPSETNQEKTVLTVRFFQDKKQIDGRGWYTPAHVSVEMSSVTMSEFVDEIQKNPDLLEDFYQKAFIGLDSTEDKPGMRRLKATGFYLIKDDKLGEATKVGNYDESGAKRFFTSLQKHQYQNGPYGSGDHFQHR